MIKEMHYQENTLFDIDPKVKGIKVTRKFAQYSRKHVTYAPANFGVAKSHGKGEDAFTKNTLFGLDFWVKVTRNIAQYARHHVNYAPAKFDITTSHG